MNEETPMLDEVIEQPEAELPEAAESDASSPLISELASLRAELSALREELNLRKKADEINRRNASRSAGRAGNNPAPEYYSPDEVRAMSPKEVRENYKKIRASMQKWH